MCYSLGVGGTSGNPGWNTVLAKYAWLYKIIKSMEGVGHLTYHIKDKYFLKFNAPWLYLQLI